MVSATGIVMVSEAVVIVTRPDCVILIMSEKDYGGDGDRDSIVKDCEVDVVIVSASYFDSDHGEWRND